jgi:hypothetical protein
VRPAIELFIPARAAQHLTFTQRAVLVALARKRAYGPASAVPLATLAGCPAGWGRSLAALVSRGWVVVIEDGPASRVYRVRRVRS